ncbi:phage minor structural protein [Streptococcus sp. F0442]|uniref:phage tail spike protein n=1 Tax=Streptococcus sp. F0442 TaxID=999425 RepID=UPI00029940E5|nr:phage tail spike protein [Streptococcus sp. F0442]EKS16608.1 phage minor structural protein [Streptococcus sp. F0442]
MIYLQEGNFPLNEAFSSEIVQEANSTYQLTFKFPTSDPKWASLIPETELVADDLHGEQYFTIFEVEKQHGYVTVYANQVATLLNGYSINKINVDRVNGATVMNALVAGFKRETPFTFFSDVMSKHTLNLKDISAMEALAKDKHSIVGQWGGDLVRDKYSVRLLEHGGIENESLFAYKKNMKSFQETKSTKELRTRIHFKKVIEAHEEGKKDQILTVTIDSPLITKYKHIYEADMEVQDQDVVDQKTLEEYGKRYFRETLCDMIEESLEIDVVGQADQPVHMFDIVSIFHESYDVDLRKKITKYKFNPMSNKLVSIGFGEVARTLADSISGMVNDSVDKKMKSYDAEYEAKVQKLVDNANAEYDKQAKELEHKITDGIEQAKAQAEVVKQEISAKVTEKINAANQANKNEIVEEFRARYNGIEVNMQGLKATTDQLKTSDADIQKLINDFKTQTQSQFVGVQGAQSRFEQTTEKAISDLINVANGKADRSYVEQTVNGIKEQLTSSTIGGPNLIRDTAYKEGTKYFGSNGIAKIGNHPFYFNGSKPILIFSNNDQTEKVISSNRFLLEKNTDYTLNFRGFNNSALTSYDVFILGRRNGETQGFTIVKQLINGKKLSTSELESVSVQFNSGDIDNAYLRFDNNGTNGGQSDLYIAEIDLYKGTQKRPWQPALEDQEYLVTQAQATFERTIQGLSTQLTQLESKAGPNGELEQRMQTYSEKAAVDALKATRQILEQGYIAKAKYDEDVAGINRRFESVATDTTPDNLIRFADTLTEYSVSNNNNNNRLSRSEDGIFKMKIDGSPSTTWLGPCFPIYIDRILQGDVYSIAFDYMIKSSVEVDKGLTFALKNHSNNTAIFAQGFADKNTPKDRWIRAEFHFTANRDFEFNKTGNFPFYIYAINNGEFWVRNPILVRGSKIPAFRPSPLDKAGTSEAKIESKIAEYRQTVDGQFTTITNQIGDMLRKTDIQITPSQISFGTGKSINGRTISSLMVQEPESIALIAQLIKVKGDMVVDGSILGRHIASESVETGHMKAGSVTTPVLASNSVTADKMLVDSAMINKLVTNQAFIRELMAQKAFITQLASIDFSAERIKGGRLESNTGSLVFDLDNSAMNMLTDTAVIRRVFNNFPTQFIRYGTHIENGNRFSKTIIGSNRDGTENSGNRTFSGIEIYNSTNEDVEDYTKFYADKLYLQHSEYKQGWIIQNAGKPRIAPLNGTTYSEMIASDFRLIYTADGNHRSVGTYLWDLLTCFGTLQKYGWDLKNSAAQRHIGGVLSKYNYR